MADRVSASITLGGDISQADLPQLVAAIAADGPSSEWDGEPFEADDIQTNQALTLMAHEVAWGVFNQIEACCRALTLPYVRWSGGFVGSFSATRSVFRGSGDPESFLVSEEDELLFSLDEILRLGTIAAIKTCADRGNFTPPILRILA